MRRRCGGRGRGPRRRSTPPSSLGTATVAAMDRAGFTPAAVDSTTRIRAPPAPAGSVPRRRRGRSAAARAARPACPRSRDFSGGVVQRRRDHHAAGLAEHGLQPEGCGLTLGWAGVAGEGSDKAWVVEQLVEGPGYTDGWTDALQHGRRRRRQVLEYAHVLLPSELLSASYYGESMATTTSAGQHEPVSSEQPEATALEEAVSQVGDRWTLLVVNSLLDGPRRFNELLDGMAGLAPNVLSKRLRHLETSGLVVATPYTRRPPRFDYRLTATGAELASAPATARALGRIRPPRRRPGAPRRMRHAGRGPLVLPDVRSPRCGRRDRRHSFRLTGGSDRWAARGSNPAP